MLSVTSAQLDLWLGAFVFPLTRILGLLAIAPVFNNLALPRRIRLALGLAITLAVAPALPPFAPIAVGSWQGLAVLAQQLLIGLTLGFTLRLVFAAVDIAGELFGLQMGLSFAIFYDPGSSGQTSVLTEFIALFATLIYLAMDGHLLSLGALAESFTLLPIAVQPVPARGLAAVVSWGAGIFSSGLLLALPLVAALLIANIALGVLARVAPTLNLFAVGFPVTLFGGIVVLHLSLPYLGAAIGHLYENGFTALDTVMRAMAAVS